MPSGRTENFSRENGRNGVAAAKDICHTKFQIVTRFGMIGEERGPDAGRVETSLFHEALNGGPHVGT